ncbi:MAG TPA: twin transmembrane helix small protein [Methylocystis sp.]|nr:twin transmembrane helix small protein [Methylocystis sp.]
MAQFPNILLLAAVAAVALVLILGVANMMRGGSPEKSQNLMRWRVGLQLLAVVIIVAILFFRR